METKKKCTQCGIEQSTTNYNKHVNTKDKLQYRCKTCCRINSKLFRQKRPDYYWGGEQGYFVKNKEKTDLYNKDYHSANKIGKVYRVDFPGGSYIGSTKRHLHTRITQHFTDYKKMLRNGKNICYLPLLHDEFDKYNFTEIKKYLKKAYLIDQLHGTSAEVKKREKEWIIKLSNEGIKLLNIQNNPNEKKPNNFVN